MERNESTSKNWEIMKLGEICEIRNGKDHKKVNTANGKYPIYGSGGIMGYANEYLCPEGTTIIGRKGSINKPLYVPCKFWNIDTAFGLVPRNNCEPRFLYYLCSSINFNKYNKSTTLPSLVKSELIKIPIPVPPLPVQARIVDELDCLQGILSKKRQQLAEYHSLAQAIFHQMFGDPVVNEKGWEVKRLGEVCELKSGFAFKSSLFKTEGLPILRISNIQHDGISTNGLAFFAKEDYKEDLEKYRVLPGDTLIALSGATTGKVGYNKTHENFYLNQRVAICREKHLCNRHFIFFILKEMSKHILEMAGGAAQPNISTKQIGLLTIPIPPLPLQQSFANRIAVINNQCKSLNKSIHEMETLLATRMDMLLNID